MEAAHAARRERLVRILSAVVTLGILFLVFYLRRMAPFGDASLAREDANIQYLQFFAWLKDVLAGRQSLRYSLSIGLGTSGVPVAVNYLFSPFNLLVVFFSRTELHSFFDIAAALKLGVCAWTFCFYLQKRLEGALPSAVTLALSVCFALMQYDLAQSSNIMWLDAVAVLPLILLGVYRVVTRGRTGLLTGAFAAGLLLNWYITGINALFSLLILILEWIWHREERDLSAAPGGGKTLLLWARSGICALFLDAWILVPLIIFLLRGKGAALDTALQPGTLLGDPSDTLTTFRLWSICLPGSVTWYCGSLALSGTALLFVLKNVSLRRKAAAAAAVLLLNLCYYWQPLFLLFSLFKEPMGHWCRYAHLGPALLLLLTALAAERLGKLPEPGRRRPVLTAAAAAGTLLAVANAVSPEGDLKRTVLTLAFLAATAAGLFLCVCPVRKRTALVLPCVVILEMAVNSWGLAGFYSTDDAAQYRQYTEQAAAQIDALRQADPELYRIGQTSYRLRNANGLTACYDESMAFGYASNTGYQSCPDNRQLDMLDALGYRTEAGCMNIVNTSVIPADSLLGVRYVLSETPVPGMICQDRLPVVQGKQVWRNPWAFPMAFTAAAGDGGEAEEDPFLYQNRLIRQITGISRDVFLPVAWSETQEEGKRIWTLRCSEPDAALYGNLPWEGEKDWTLTVSGQTTAYGCWLSPSVFSVPAGEDGTSVVTLEGSDLKLSALPQFYVLDRTAMEQASAAADARAWELRTEDGAGYSLSGTAGAGEVLYLNIPYSPDWTVTVNGAPAAPAAYGSGDAMMVIPLEQGECSVTLRYRIPGMGPGAELTALAVMVLLLSVLRPRKKNS